MIVSSFGNVWRSRRWVSISAVSSPACVEAAATVVRSPIAACSFCRAVAVGRRLRHVELEIAGGGDARRAEVAVARSVGRRLRQAQIEAAQERRDHARRVAPAIVRALRHPAVDHDERDVALRAHQDQVRPQVGFGEQREIGLPMVEEARHEARRIERHVLVDHRWRQPLQGELRRGDGARGDEDVELLARRSARPGE